MKGEIFEVGDTVCVLDQQQISKEFYGDDEFHALPIGSFNEMMLKYCGQCFTIAAIQDCNLPSSVAPNGGSTYRYILDPSTGTFWRDYMLKRVDNEPDEVNYEAWMKAIADCSFE